VRGGFYPRRGKRWLDLVLLVSSIPVTLPLLALTAAFVWLALGRPVLFRQQRPGRGGVRFGLLKFRTMSAERNPRGALLPDDQRLSRAGRALRSTSLDELPELLNILRGEMSFVGPRPLLVAYMSRYSPEQARRHEVIPGLTGWAQVNGRNAVSWEAKFDLDVWYVDHCSFLLDLRILALTFWRVLTRRGISGAGVATASEFKGSPDRGANTGNSARLSNGRDS
jgi:sugar transferase EpsL